MNRVIPFILAFSLPLLTSFTHAQTPPSTTLLLGGTGAATGAMKLLGEAYESAASQVRVNVFPSLGSGGGVRALLADKLHMAFTSRPLKETESAQGLTAHAIIKTPFVFVTHRDVNIDNLSFEDIAEIYSGARTHWPNQQLIRPVLRPLYDADSKIIMAMSPALASSLEQAHSHSGKNIAATDFDSANEMERIAGAFGTTTTLLIKAENRRLNMPQLNGIAPTPENYRAGRYPYGKTIYAILPTAPAAEAVDFLAFLRSEHAHKLIRALDALPVSEP